MISSLSHKQKLRLLQHQPGGEILLGCTNCRHLDTCGGISIEYPAWSCRDLCSCNDGVACNAVCPRSAKRFVALLHEVDGFDLMTLPVASPVNCEMLAEYVPMVYSASSRADALSTPTVAVPLAAIFAHDTGVCRFTDRASLFRAFRVDDHAQLVISGVDEDRRVEAYWSRGRDAGLVNAIAALQPAVVTAPNFSLLSDVARHDNLVNMKRIAIAWLEMTLAGIPTALHVNARTVRDWQRWADFIIRQPAVRAIAFEFATGARVNNRGRWYVDQLIKLADAVKRPLHLILRGTTRHDDLRRAFDRVTLLDTSAYSKATRRLKAFQVGKGKVRWHRSFTLKGQPIDDILQHNVSICQAAYSIGAMPRLPAA